MLLANQTSQNYPAFSFNPEISSSRELVSDVYKKVNNWEKSDAYTGFSLEAMLEILDAIRIPLARKKINGENLSQIEETCLLMSESLTDKVLTRMEPLSDEPSEVRTAMLHAKRILQSI